MKTEQIVFSLPLGDLRSRGSKTLQWELYGVYKIMIKKIFPKTAIISQSNKNGLKEFANQIQNLGILYRWNRKFLKK